LSFGCVYSFQPHLVVLSPAMSTNLCVTECMSRETDEDLCTCFILYLITLGCRYVCDNIFSPWFHLIYLHDKVVCAGCLSYLIDFPVANSLKQWLSWRHGETCCRDIPINDCFCIFFGHHRTCIFIYSCGAERLRGDPYILLSYVNMIDCFSLARLSSFPSSFSGILTWAL